MNARCFLVALTLLFQAGLASAQQPEYKPGEVFVRFKSGTPETERAVVRAQMNGSLIRKFAGIDVEHIRLLVGSVGATIQQFSSHPLIEYVEPNHALTPAAEPNDTLFPQLWNMQNIGQGGGTPLADIRVVPVWDAFTGDPTLKVGVLDFGVSHDIPDMVNNIWTNPGDPTVNDVDDDKNGYIDDVHGFNFRDDFPPPDGNGIWDGNEGIQPFDPYGHGTHVAGITAGRGNNATGIAGVCWETEVVTIQVLGATTDFVDAAVAGLYYAQAVGCRVVNASFGSQYANNETFRLAIRDVCGTGSGGMLVVAAAHNQNRNNDEVPMYPASFNIDRIISVAGTDASDALGYTDLTYGSTTVRPP